MKSIALGLCLVALPSFASPTADARKAIDAANAKWMAAMKNHDAKAVAAVYSEDAVLLTNQGPELKGREAIGNMLGGNEMAAVKEIKLETVELHVMGDTAIEVGHWSLTLQPPGGQAIENADHGKALVVWKKQGGQWRMWRDIWNSSVAPQAPATPAKAEASK